MNCRENLASLKTLDVIWCCGHPPDITESVFSYDYCRKTSRQLCESKLNVLSWHDLDFGFACSADEKARFFLHYKELGADCLMIVSNPEIVISPAAVKKMMQTLENGVAVILPVFNETSNSSQSANMPWIYFNLSTYLEVSEFMADINKSVMLNGIETCGTEITPENIDCSCVLIQKEFVENFISFIEHGISLQDALTSFISYLVSRKLCVIETSALLHSFSGSYYGGKRIDLADLVPDLAENILDVGCASGGFGELMKTRRSDIHITGVEMNSILAENASRHYDQIHNNKIEDIHFKTTFDHINCGDIIEHLDDPWQMLKLFYILLKKGGSLVISIPNAGHWTIVKDLAAGRFEYIPGGLLCLTHIRWFTEKSIKEALQEAGFDIELFHQGQIPPTPCGERFIELLCDNNMGDRTSLLTNAFTIRAWKR
ncbi:MAG: class I SAM-dependent methyltransferase [Desulfamplus sp.]|nr:class I SAM-dependent methyltransferase [Desulfamplus sp.]